MLSITELADLAAQLRRRGYETGPHECISASRLLFALEQQGQSPGQGALPSLLTPIFCSDAREQQSIHDEIAAWLKQRSGSAEKAPGTSDKPPVGQTGQPTSTAPNSSTGVLTWRLARSVGASLLVILLVVVWAIGRNPTQAPIERPTPSASAPRASAENPIPQAEPQPTVEASYFAKLPALPDVAGQAFVTSLVILSLLGALLLAAYRRKLALQAAERAAPPMLRNIASRADGFELFDRRAVRLVAQSLRRYVPSVTTDVDAAATVVATTRQGGLFHPVYQSRKALPAYLALIDLAGTRDHQARWATKLVQQLADCGVEIDRYYFNGDPRHCQTRFDSPRNIRVTELLALHHDRTVIIFSGAEGVFNPLTAEPHDWLANFNPHGHSVVATPVAMQRWGYREFALRELGFVVTTADIPGLPLAAGTSHAIETISQKPPARKFPSVLSDGDPRWLDRLAPSQPEQDRLANQLKWFLGPPVYAWLAACAIYPVLQWEVTLHLGRRLFSNAGELRAGMASLIQLPWFRSGALPPWLRQRLVIDLSEVDEKVARAAYRELMHEDPGVATFALEVATGASSPNRSGDWLARWHKWREQRRVRAAALSSHPASVLRDYAFVSFMRGTKASRLQLEVPESWRRLLERGMWPPWQHWAAFAMGSLILGSVAWQLTGLHMEGRPQVIEGLAIGTSPPNELVARVRGGQTLAWQPAADGKLQSASPAPDLAGTRWNSPARSVALSVAGAAGQGGAPWTAGIESDGVVWLRRPGSSEGVSLQRSEQQGLASGLVARVGNDEKTVSLALATDAGEVALFLIKLPSAKPAPEPLPPKEPPPPQCAECPEMVEIPAGSFSMGSPDSEPGRSPDESPTRRVTIAKFSLAKTEVTQGQWRAVMGSNPSTFKKCGDKCPVESVSWADAQSYIQRLNKQTGRRYRLPSEAEWEYAARAGSTAAYPWGNGIGLNYANCAGCRSLWDGKSTSPIGQFQANRFGLVDMIGNVSEWVQDCYEMMAYSGPSTGNRALESLNCPDRVVRGGAWNTSAADARAAFRTGSPTANRSSYTGFRVALSM